MTTSTTPRAPRWRRPALSKVVPVIFALGSLLVALVIVLTHPSQPGVAAGVLTASGSNGAPVGNGNDNGNIDPTTGCNANGNCVKSFGVMVGDVSDLYPGRTLPLTVSYINRYAFDIRVTDATGTAVLSSNPSSSGGTCSAAYLTVDGYHAAPGLLVAARGSRSTSLNVTLSPAAPDACKQAVWTITVTAQAVK